MRTHYSNKISYLFHSLIPSFRAFKCTPAAEPKIINLSSLFVYMRTEKEHGVNRSIINKTFWLGQIAETKHGVSGPFQPWILMTVFRSAFGKKEGGFRKRSYKVLNYAKRIISPSKGLFIVANVSVTLGYSIAFNVTLWGAVYRRCW